MFTTENEVIDWIYSFRNMQPDRNLDHLHTFLAELGNPHLAIPTVHVAGTNGKGSTVSYIREAFMQSGYKVATFTSPFIICFGERMSINNRPMSEANLIKYAGILAAKLPESTSKFTSFDLLTLISFLYFKETCVDIAIYETGIGGRLDATNVINPLATAITNVGHDHADVLGDSQAERATEKLGIVKPNAPLFTTEADPELLTLFKEVCNSRKSELVLALKDAKLVVNNEAGVHFKAVGTDFKIAMCGEHQFRNATLAVNVLEYLRVNCGFDQLNPTKISTTRWQGRFEVMQQSPTVVIDGAHNLEGIEALVATVKAVYPDVKKKIMFSAIASKDAGQMIALLAEIADEFIFTKGTHFQSIEPAELSTKNTKIPQKIYNNHQNALTTEIAELTEADVLVVCGSLYFISDVRSWFKS